MAPKVLFCSGISTSHEGRPAPTPPRTRPPTRNRLSNPCSTTLSESSRNSLASSDRRQAYFQSVVVVHGLHGARRPPWKNPGSGDSSWVAHPPYWNRRVMSFGYSASKLLAGRFTRQAIRRASRSLLSQLSRRRAADTPGRAEGVRTTTLQTMTFPMPPTRLTHAGSADHVHRPRYRRHHRQRCGTPCLPVPLPP